MDKIWKHEMVLFLSGNPILPKERRLEIAHELNSNRELEQEYQALLARFRSPYEIDWMKLAELVSAESSEVQSASFDELTPTELHELVYREAQVFEAAGQGDYVTAINLGKKLDKYAAAKFGSNHPSRLHGLNALASVQFEVGSFYESYNHFSLALSFCKQMADEAQPFWIAILCSRIAIASAELGRFDESIQNAKLAIKQDEWLANETQEPFIEELRLKIRIAMANSLFMLEKWDDAEEALSRVFAEEAKQNFPIQYFGALNLRALIEQRTNRFTAALDTQIDCLALAEKTVGRDAPIYPQLLANLASTYVYQNELGQALEILEPIAQQLVEDQVANYGTACILINLGSVFLSVDRLQDADEVFSLAGQALEKVGAGDSFASYVLRINIGGLLVKLGQSAEAKKYLGAIDVPDSSRLTDALHHNMNAKKTDQVALVCV